MAAEQHTWELSQPLDLGATLRSLRRGGSDPTRQVGPSRARWSITTASGPASLAVAVHGSELVAASVGPGSADALARVPALVGLDDHHQLPTDAPAALGRLARRHVGARLGSTGDLAGALLPAVLGQRVTSGEAHGTWAALCRRFGGTAPVGAVLDRLAPADRPLMLPAPPEAIASLTAHELHGFGVERARGDVLVNVARRAGSLARLVDLPGAEARRRLCTLRGVGPWTAAIATRVAQGDPDAVLVGDLHVPSNVAWFLAGEPRADDRRMLELLAPYAGQRARVQHLIGLSGASAPRRGPRYRPLPIARW